VSVDEQIQVVLAVLNGELSLADQHVLGPVPPKLTFAHVPEAKTVKNRLHLDLNPTDTEQDQEVRRLLDLGARHADVGQGDAS
jgi:hypothetical protein